MTPFPFATTFSTQEPPLRSKKAGHLAHIFAPQLQLHPLRTEQNSCIHVNTIGGATTLAKSHVRLGSPWTDSFSTTRGQIHTTTAHTCLLYSHQVLIGCSSLLCCSFVLMQLP